MTLANLDTLIMGYVGHIYYPTPTAFEQTELYAITVNAINDYTNIHLDGYTSQQNYFITVLLNAIFEVPVESINEFLEDVNDQITRSNMTMAEKVPLYMAVAVGVNNYAYWLTEIRNTSSNFYTFGYFNNREWSNTAALPYWVAAAIHGTLSGANKARTYGLVDPQKIIGVDIVTALWAGLAVGVGKVMFKFLPRLSSNSNVSGCGCGN